MKQNSEFDLIDHITTGFIGSGETVHTSIGDDAAVLKNADGSYNVLTVDTLVEGDHFRCDWSPAKSIGQKAAESNLSDIAAMGALPKYALIAAVLRTGADAKWLSEVYAGIKESFAKYGVILLGGDTTHGDIRMLSVTMIGTTDAAHLCLRSGANVEDLICVTGQVGGSAAGYYSLKNNKPLSPYLEERHIRPACRLDISEAISNVATAMIDVSDGVGSEVRHICKNSQLGAHIYEEKLPVHPDVHAAEKALNLAKNQCAMSGGEDFELLFTVNKKDLSALKNIDYTVIGTMVIDPNEQLFYRTDGTTQPIPKGWDHVVQTA